MLWFQFDKMHSNAITSRQRGSLDILKCFDINFCAHTCFVYKLVINCVMMYLGCGGSCSGGGGGADSGRSIRIAQHVTEQIEAVNRVVRAACVNLHVTNRLHDDCTEPHTDVRRHHVHQTKPREHSVAMDTHLQ